MKKREKQAKQPKPTKARKPGRKLLIFLIIVAVLYGGYMFFLNPTGYTDTGDLTRDFIANMNDANACATYFHPETEGYCETFVELFDGETVSVTALSKTSQSVLVTLAVGSNSDTFEVTFIEEDVSGIKGFFHPAYYKIDVIQ